MQIVKRVVLLALVVSAPAHAELYRCKGADGQLQFQDHPCAGAKSTDNVMQVKPLNPPPATPSAITSDAATKSSAEHDELERLRAENQSLKAQPQPDVNALIDAATKKIQQANACKRPTSNEISHAVFNNRVLICMTKAEVIKAAGKYSEFQPCGTGANEAWFFPRTMSDFPSVVRFDTDGKVAAFGMQDCIGFQMHH